MYPIIYNYKMLTIGGYGILLGLAFYLGFLIGERELKVRNKNPELAYILLLVAIPSAIIGAKLFYILEDLNAFFQDKWGMIFSGAGLSVYGGFVFAIIACAVVIKLKNENVLEILDAACPTMALGYAIGRLGCHVAGDGCYGIASESFFSVAYPNGLVPTSSFVLPTPLFESFFSFIILIIVLQVRKREMPVGKLFFIYLILNGVARFSIEFIRLNPKFIFALTQAQFVAILFVITGILGLILIQKKEKGSLGV